LTASFSGDSIYGPKNNTATVTVSGIVLPVPTITVTPASNSLDSVSTLGVTGTVASPTQGGTTPTGTVTITAGTYTASMGLSASGGFSFTVPSGALSGTANGESVAVTVVYGGDGNYQSATGSANVTVTESTFSITQTPISLTPSGAGSSSSGIAPGSSATATVTVTSLAGYAGTVTLTCQEEADASPTTGDGATCGPTGASASVTVSSGASGTTQFTVGSTAPSTTIEEDLKHKAASNHRGWAGAGGGAVLALLVFLGIPARRRSWRAMLGVLLLMAGLGSLSGCGSSSNNTGTITVTDPGTAKGTYTFTIVATGTATGTGAVTKNQTTFTVYVN
jgi:hypothetical protein